MPVWGEELSPATAAAVWSALTQAENGRVAATFFVEAHPLLDTSGLNVLAMVYQFGNVFLPWTEPERGREGVVMGGAWRAVYQEKLAEHDAKASDADRSDPASFARTWGGLGARFDARADACRAYFEVIGSLTCKQASDLAQYLMHLGKVKVWDERLTLPGTSKGLFVRLAAGDLLNEGYEDALLSVQGTGIYRPLGVRFADVTPAGHQGRVPSMIRDHNRAHGRGAALVGPLYMEDVPIRDPGVNVTTYLYPRTLRTGAHAVADMAEIAFLEKPAVGHRDSPFFKKGGARSADLEVFKGLVRGAVRGHSGFGDRHQFPASLDVFSSPSPATLDWWDDSMLRPVPLRFAREIDADDTASYGPGGAGAGGQRDYRHGGFGGVSTTLHRYEHRVAAAPRYASDARAPLCMVDLSNLYQGVGFMLGAPGYGECDEDIASGVPPGRRVTGLSRRGEDFVWSPSYFDFEPVTGRTYYSNYHVTTYASQPFSMRFFYAGVEPAVVPFHTLRRHHAPVTRRAAAEFEDTVAVVKKKMALTALFGVATGAALVLMGAILYLKTRVRWRRTQVIYPHDDFKMRVEQRGQVLYKENVEAYTQAKGVFKGKSRKVVQFKEQHRLELAAAMAETKARNAEIFAVMDGMVKTDEKGDRVFSLEGNSAKKQSGAGVGAGAGAGAGTSPKKPDSVTEVTKF
jgi:hypothetical protein